MSAHPSLERRELGHPAIPALHALCSYPLFHSGESQDVAHDFCIHAGEQLLLGGMQRDATVGAHENGTKGLGSLCLLPLLSLCQQRCPETSAPGLPRAPVAVPAPYSHQLLVSLGTSQQLPTLLLEL